MPDTVTARHVLVNTKAEAEKVQKLLAADNSDANWKKVAKQYSIDPGTKDKGGDLGTFPKGRMVPEFEKVAFSIKPGIVSAPVKTQFGWHVIEVTKKTPGSTKTFEEAKPMIEQTLKFQLQTKAWDDLARRRREGGQHQVRARFRPHDAHRLPEPQRLGGAREPGPVADELTEPARAGHAAAP